MNQGAKSILIGKMNKNYCKPIFNNILYSKWFNCFYAIEPFFSSLFSDKKLLKQKNT